MADTSSFQHDPLYVDLWGENYRNDPDFIAWTQKVQESPSRGLKQHQNDLRDLCFDRMQPASKVYRQAW